MAAYASLVSVMQILDQIEHHPSPPLSLHKQQVESLTRNVVYFQEFLQGYNPRVSNNNEADPLEMRIAEAAYAAEDVIESSVVDRIHLAGSESRRNEMGFFKLFRGSKEPKDDGETINHIHTNLYEGLQRVIDEMDSIKKQVMTEVVADRDQLQRNVSPFAGSSVSSSFGQKSSTMLGNDEVLLEIMDKLIDGRSDCQVIPIVGMGGIGKTTLARTVYAQQLIIERFDILAWVTISQQYDTKEIICQLLSQANKESSRGLSNMTKDKLGETLHKCLFGRRFLFVLDDMWSIEAWYELQRYFPDNSNSSRIMVTTRLSNLGSLLNNNYGVDMEILDEVSSWNLFTEIVFGGRNCPLQLEMIGKEIVNKCRGLPLSIVVMGGILQKLEHTIECWESIGRNLTASTMNLENDEQCLRILKMSYSYLPVHLKPCFLFMGVYEEDTTILVSALINLWVSEGFVRPISSKSLETVGKEYLKELVDRRLIQVDLLGSTGNIKYCKMHDLVRDLSLREAEKERFYHVVGRHSLEGAHNQRRIVVMGSASEKEVREALESMPHARSCICDNKEVGMLPNSRLLRAFKSYRRYTEMFPPMPSPFRLLNSTIGYYFYGTRDRKLWRQKYSLRKIFELVNLRYLFVKAGHSHWYNEFPSTVGLLWNLQTLVVAHSRKQLQAPVEIWKMPQLRHVHFCQLSVRWSIRSHGSLNLPDPPIDNTIIMENLQTLKGVRNLKCSEEVVRRIPNIKKLEIYYVEVKGNHELSVNYYCLANLKCLRKLESLTCHGHWFEPLHQKLSFPLSLRKLSLHYIWLSREDMVMISSLPLLQKLKLTGGQAFESGKWETYEDQFRSLRSLSLFFSDGLKEWVMEESSHFPCLEQLRLFGVEELEEIPAEIGEIPTLQSIHLVVCSESVVRSAHKIVEQQQELQGDDQLSFKVYVWLSNKLETAPNPNIHLY